MTISGVSQSVTDNCLLLALLAGESSSTDAQLALGLVSHHTTTPLSVLSVLGGEGLLEGVQSSLILGVHTGQAHAGGGLLVDESTESGLTLDDGVGDTHLVAEGGEPHHQLEGIHIIGNEHQLGLLLLDQLGDVVQTVLDDQRSALLLHGLSLSLSLSLGSETSLLLSGGLGGILSHEAEHLSSLILSQSVLELVHGGRNLQALRQDLALSLEDHVTGPSDKSGQISLVLCNHTHNSLFLP